MQSIESDRWLRFFYVFSIALSLGGLVSVINGFTPEYGLIIKAGKYVGQDFLLFYAAAKFTLLHNFPALYSNYWAGEITYSLVPEIGDGIVENWAFLYPPHYLLLLAPLGVFPYYYALAVWIFISVGLCGIILRNFGGIKGVFFWIAILNINVLNCLQMGQNALIFSSLAGIGIMSLEKRPIVSGICFSIVSMKPHFALLLPVAMLLGRYWQALFYTIVSTLFLMLLASLFFGVDIWLLALQHFGAASDIVTSKFSFLSIYSIYLELVQIGIKTAYAWTGQFLVAGIALYFFQNIWCKNSSLESKWMSFGITALLVSPYNLKYDSVWAAIPSLIFLYNTLINKNKNTEASWYIYALLLIQIFSFVLVEISNLFSIPIIISAIMLLFLINRQKHEKPD